MMYDVDMPCLSQVVLMCCSTDHVPLNFSSVQVQRSPLLITLCGDSGGRPDRQDLSHQKPDVLPSGLCYPHSVVFYTKRADRKKITSGGQVRF
jgi:hypothetical protein